MYQIPLGAWGWSWALPIRLEVFVMSAVQAAGVTDSPVVVAVDVGKKTVALSVTDAGRHRLLGPVDFEMTGRGVDGVLALISSRLAGADAPVKVGIEAAGPTRPDSRRGANMAGSSPARWPTVPPGSPTPWSGTRPPTTPPVGCDEPPVQLATTKLTVEHRDLDRAIWLHESPTK